MKRRHLIGAFALGLMLGFGAGFLWHAYKTEAGPFNANRARDVRAETASGRRWAQRLQHPGLPVTIESPAPTAP